MLNNEKCSVQLNDITTPNKNLLDFKLTYGNGSKFNITNIAVSSKF